MNLQNSDNIGPNEPVTVIVTRKAKKGKIKEFEEWMDGIVHEAMKFEGHINKMKSWSDSLVNQRVVK